jgi:hypothetical protein
MKIRFVIAGQFLITAAALFAAGTASAADNGWRNCAQEGQTCDVRGRAVVRYGDQGRWNTRTVSGPVACNNDTFGDPAPERRKRCQVRGGNSQSPGNGGGQAGWRRCADEGQVCRVGGRAQVRYGTAGRYVYRDVVREVRCDTRSFGRDPFDGRRKSCDIRR